MELKDNHDAGSILSWTGTFLVGLGETLVLVYLLLTSGDLFLQKLVRVMLISERQEARGRDHYEIQQNISN